MRGAGLLKASANSNYSPTEATGRGLLYKNGNELKAIIEKPQRGCLLERKRYLSMKRMRLMA